MLRSLLLVLVSLVSALAFVPAGPMTMPLRQRQLSTLEGLQMKALNKPARLSEKRRVYNKGHKSEMRTYIKKVPRSRRLAPPLPPRSRRCSLCEPFSSANLSATAQANPREANAREANAARLIPRYRPHANPALACRAAAQTLLACEDGDYAVASPLLSKTQSVIDKNVKRGLIHKNTAARKKSQLTLKVKRLEPGASAEPEPVAA